MKKSVRPFSNWTGNNSSEALWKTRTPCRILRFPKGFLLSIHREFPLPGFPSGFEPGEAWRTCASDSTGFQGFPPGNLIKKPPEEIFPQGSFLRKSKAYRIYGTTCNPDVSDGFPSITLPILLSVFRLSYDRISNLENVNVRSPEYMTRSTNWSFFSQIIWAL